MSTNEDVHRELFERLNKNEDQISNLLGKVGILVEQNDKFLKLIGKAISALFWVCVMLIGAIIYGAIGKDGFYAVRSLPTTVAFDQPAIPNYDDRKVFL